MDGPRHQFLAGAALTGHQHGRPRIGGIGNLLVDGEHAGGTPDHAGWHFITVVQRQRRLRAFRERALNGCLHLSHVERLADVVECSRADGGHRRLQRAERADQHHLSGRMGGLHLFQDVEAGLRGIEVDVGDDEIERLLSDLVQRLTRRHGFCDRSVRCANQLGDQPARLAVVIDDEDLLGQAHDVFATGNDTRNVVPGPGDDTSSMVPPAR
jgi:hypothetical protein